MTLRLFPWKPFGLLLAYLLMVAVLCVACASPRYLVDKRGCDFTGPDHITCPESSVHKIK